MGKLKQESDVLPLSLSSLQVLLALSERPLHGYGIMQQARHDSGGAVVLGSGALAKTLERLLELGAIERGGLMASERSPHQRKLYKITHFGCQLLSLELDRLATSVSLGRLRLKIGQRSV